MSDKKSKNIYDDDNIPEVDLPRNCRGISEPNYDAESLPESSLSEKDSPKTN
uniref:hypothetical protein n=1 Tax=Agathobacter sp. TaxID=2021311 RepID=UPI004056EF97